MAQIAEDNQVWIKPIYLDLTDEQQIKAGIKRILDKKSRLMF